ncbi:zinc finger protein 26-like [Anthonomus grandis grandis]|uniref:zinc finger protein 26-like n=1 Tax=Anthonomus grandis grandis TaxID=2921223 RepID=UPI0021653EDF|nr:zinc finger protein 26-like [Anthonomus grandis grandis]
MDEPKEFCRLCLTTSVVYYSLLKDNGKEMVLSLTGLLITEEHPNTTYACVKCWVDLKLAYSIQQRFYDAEQKFQLEGITSVIDKINLYRNQTKPDQSKPEAPDIKEEIIENEYDDPSALSDDDIDYDEMIVIQTEEEASALDPILNPIPSSEMLECPICGLKCEDMSAIYTHTKTHYNEEQQCETCFISYPNIAAYREHIKNSHPEKSDHIYNCGICPMMFQYKSLYDIHLGTIHKYTAKRKRTNRDISKYYIDSTSLKCPDCNKACSDGKALRAHIKTHERKPCHICGANITSSNIAKHIENHEIKPVVCHICGITVKNRDSLRGHVYYTHSQKRLKCDLCPKIFTKLYPYKMHIKKEHTGERSFTCDTCGKQFFTHYQLSNHIKMRHLKQRNHVCAFCSKGFSSKFALKTHERQHTNEAPYICSMCGTGFRQNVSLRAHLKSKHNIKEDQTAECVTCGKKFKDDWALKTHIRSVHD